MCIYKKAMDFTLLVERFLRTDHPEGVKPATESEVASAMYALRAAIPVVTRNTDVVDYARAWEAEAAQHAAALKETAEMAKHLRWALRRISTSLTTGDHFDAAEACLAKYDERLAEVEGEWMALSQDQGKLEGQIDRLVAQRDELLEALKGLVMFPLGTFQVKAARAAIAKAEQNT